MLILGYGFALSEEAEGAFWTNNRVNDPVGSEPLLPCSPPTAVQNPNPINASLEAAGVGIPTDIYDSAHALSEVGAALIGNTGFLLSTLFAVPHANGNAGGIQPLDVTPSTNGPAWLAVGIGVTNTANFVQFDAAFTDTSAAQGLLSAYWDTNQIGMVDERVASTRLQSYRFFLPDTVTSGIYTLSFRLDSFAGLSSIIVTNVATGFVGVTQPITLNMSLAKNSAPLLQLTAATNYTYLIQSSTNLVDWTPVALLLNTNGTVLFADPTWTNLGARFYRALLP